MFGQIVGFQWLDRNYKQLDNKNVLPMIVTRVAMRNLYGSYSNTPIYKDVVIKIHQPLLLTNQADQRAHSF